MSVDARSSEIPSFHAILKVLEEVCNAVCTLWPIMLLPRPVLASDFDTQQQVSRPDVPVRTQKEAGHGLISPQAVHQCSDVSWPQHHFAKILASIRVFDTALELESWGVIVWLEIASVLSSTDPSLPPLFVRCWKNEASELGSAICTGIGMLGTPCRDIGSAFGSQAP